jgi:preprotein translocase subunit SecD
MMTSLLRRAVAYAAILLLLQGALPISTSAEEIIVLNVVSARVDHDVRTGEPLLAIKLDEASRRTFSTFSSTYVGSKTELRVDGKVIAEPVIREPITGGSLHIDVGGQTEMANTLAEQVSRPGARVEMVLSK